MEYGDGADHMVLNIGGIGCHNARRRRRYGKGSDLGSGALLFNQGASCPGGLEGGI